MPVPPDPILKAAARWLERLPNSSPARCRALFTTLVEYSDISPTQYDAALAWLERVSLLERLDDLRPVNLRVFDEAILNGNTIWFADADQLVRSPEELPDDAARAAKALGIEDDSAFKQVTAAWGKVDVGMRAMVGAAGETALVDLLRQWLSARVEHVSLISDGYGYDVEVHACDRVSCLEIKSTIRTGRLAVYLSRNEFEALRRLPQWQMVTVRMTPDFDIVAIASIPRDWLLEQVPRDNGAFARWESCRLDVPDDVPIPGIPAIEPLLAADRPPLLRGGVLWSRS